MASGSYPTHPCMGFFSHHTSLYYIYFIVYSPFFIIFTIHHQHPPIDRSNSFYALYFQHYIQIVCWQKKGKKKENPPILKGCWVRFSVRSRVPPGFKRRCYTKSKRSWEKIYRKKMYYTSDCIWVVAWTALTKGWNIDFLHFLL